MQSFITVGAKNLTSIILPEFSITFTDVLTTTHGPHAMRHIMGFNNHTVVDKVPQDMLHLVDSHWLLLNVSYSCIVLFCKDRETNRNV